MTIRFKRFPLLVKLEILKSLDYREFFILTLCSLKIQNFLKTIKCKQMKFLRYFFDEKLIRIWTKDDEREKIPIIAFERVAFFDTTEKVEIVRIGSVVQPIVYFPNGERGYCVLKYIDTEEEVISNSIAQHVSGLLSKCSCVQLRARMSSTSKMLPAFQGITDTQFDGGNVDAKFLEKYFGRNPNQKSARIIQKVTGELAENSNLLQISNLCLADSGSLSKHILRKFNGRDLHLYNADIDTFNLITFLKLWVSNKAYSNLKSLNVLKRYNFYSDFNLAIVQKEVNLIAHNRQYPRFYNYKPEIYRMIGNNNPMRIVLRRSFVIRREGDGKVAFLLLEPDSFWFLVSE
ncbi:hypothetical protein CAEBREN_23387 [Caenorhabditis brenneri]|uniref:F-box domain-containing protein n=1 Tax=Caenorhabditis brenneri TaxID=135651 RepID=G0NLR3_CAEBE|nr:hypothetical protein CAEBREN_23387 [Caenorhabditis brenneri]